jgi:hypothetical protein
LQELYLLAQHRKLAIIGTRLLDTLSLLTRHHPLYELKATKRSYYCRCHTKHTSPIHYSFSSPFFVNAFIARNGLLLTEVLAPTEKWKREQLSEILQSWLELTEEALACRMGLQAVSPLSRKLSTSCTSAQLHDGACTLKKAVAFTAANVSPAAVCGWLTWALR